MTTPMRGKFITVSVEHERTGKSDAGVHVGDLSFAEPGKDPGKTTAQNKGIDVPEKRLSGNPFRYSNAP